jgi:hypothetical protein
MGTFLVSQQMGTRLMGARVTASPNACPSITGFAKLHREHWQWLIAAWASRVPIC